MVSQTALDVIEEERLSTSWPEYGLEAKGHPCGAQSRLYVTHALKMLRQTTCLR